MSIFWFDCFGFFVWCFRYGLLGASGCGKTTLLSCIVGQKKLQDGHISVLGTCLNTHSATTLGPRIGYMPQDIALVNELSIKETIYYFGRIYGMHDDRIRERFKILKDLLELPDGNRLVENLSGGQKRRVSFACALVHGNYILKKNCYYNKSHIFVYMFFFLIFCVYSELIFPVSLLFASIQNRNWSYWTNPQLV